MQLQIEDLTRKLRTGDLGIPPNPEDRLGPFTLTVTLPPSRSLFETLSVVLIILVVTMMITVNGFPPAPQQARPCRHGGARPRRSAPPAAAGEGVAFVNPTTPAD